MAGGSCHVLHIVPGLAPGGMELAMAGVIRGLSRPDMRHSIICLKGEPLIRDWLPRSTEIHCLHSPPNDPLLPVQLWRLIQRIGPTVIHARNWGAWPDVALARLGVYPPVPMIFSFHGFARYPVPLRRRLGFRVLAHLTTHLVTVSESSRHMLAKDMGWPLRRVQVVPNGVDTHRFVPRAEKKRLGRLILGTVGSLTPVKNHTMLVRACRTILDGGLDCEVRIAGEGPQREAVSRLIEEFGLSQRVLLLGHQEDVPAFLRQLDVFVLPSASEAHPNALLEAMACALPCVATGVGGVNEVLDDDKYGLVIPPGDEEGLVRAITKLAGDPQLRLDLAAAARRQVCECYSLQATIIAYEDMYRRLSRCERRPAPVPPGRRRRASLRVLMLGPLPPLTGGMATVTTNLAGSRLRQTCDLRVMNNGKITPEKRPLVVGIAAQIRLWGQVIVAVCRHRPQIVHIHTCALFSFWRDQLHMLSSRLLGAKGVWHLHDGTFLPFVSQGSRLKRGLIRGGLHLGSAVIVLSEESRCKLRQHVPRAHWQVVTNAVPLPVISSKPSDGPVKFLFLGNLTRRKGAYDLVNAAEAATAAGAQLQVSLCGTEGVGGERQELLDYIARLACRERILLPGVVLGADKARQLTQADCLVLPSYAEGLPLAVLEGMSYGLPVVTTNVGAIPEVVRDGCEGFLLEPGDVKGLSQRMLQLCRDAPLRRRMGELARNRVEEAFTLDVAVDRIMAIYRSVLAR